ncbi:MAG: copper amine oxidase N-terminal domain-containing protein [Peptoniphilus sp.]|uniref:copper amine oxidase N-terminal domain-containing protein n=1 Tax=Peptoniphilus sp. TaxID=1971214 RepID=UPI002A7593FD|nr:copper amine oxidase N-terminal domain-containing protein [Peptoniphilus sp.]MDY2986490.1 copper amine oxidase N-terminal domain-containing protein [Peptoniphilus sp.]
MKKIITVLICIFTMSSLCFASKRELKVYIMGQQFEDISGIFLQQETGRVMVPVRRIAEKFGATVEYLPPTEERGAGFVINKNDISIRMFEDSSRAYLMKNSNMKSIDMGAKVVNINSINFVPVRFISENLNFKVEWKNFDGYDLVEITENKNI